MQCCCPSVKLHQTFCEIFNSNFFTVKISERLPFDWKNPMGYGIALVIQFIAVIFIFNVVGGVTSFGIGYYLFANATIKEFKSSIHLLEDSAKENGELLRALNRFAEFIEWHSILNQLSITFKAYRYIL